jgi:hypothetical protein
MVVRLAAAVCVLAAALAPPAVAGTGAQPPSAEKEEPRLTERRATRLVLAEDKVRDWLERYPSRTTTDATFDEDERTWEVRIWSGEAGQIAEGKVDDRTGAVTEAWTGPQVAWKMARGGRGAFGGTEINRPLVWLLFCGAFLLGLADLRRPLGLRNLDLLALLSFSISLWFFNRGEVFWSAPLAYPPLVYLAARLAWIGVRGRSPAASRPVWPAWLLVGATVFLVGFRVGLNVQASNVIDVGYSGVVGAHRIASAQSPYGNFPVRDGRPVCRADDDADDVRERIQTNGRCETANERGDTYGPVAYIAYLPGYGLFGWSGKWEGGIGFGELPAAHVTAIVFDLLCLLGLALVGLRLGGLRLAATLAFAWAAYPFTQYASSSNTNDAIMPAFLIWGFWLASRPGGRGALVALAGWTKFATLLVVPLWARYGDGRRSVAGFLAGFAAATLAAFSVLLLEPSLVDAARTFVERTLGWQIGRDSPFSIWGWGQYRAEGLPDLGWLQLALEIGLVTVAVALAFVPRRLTPIGLAALTGALVVGFQIVLTHWSYLYIPWFFPFAAVALLAVVPAAPEATEPEPVPGRETRELVPAG